MTKQDWMISIEGAISALCKVGKNADVEYVLRIFGHGARCAEDLLPGDFDMVFSELYQRFADLDD